MTGNEAFRVHTWTLALAALCLLGTLEAGAMNNVGNIDINGTDTTAAAGSNVAVSFDANFGVVGSSTLTTFDSICGSAGTCVLGFTLDLQYNANQLSYLGPTAGATTPFGSDASLSSGILTTNTTTTGDITDLTVNWLGFDGVSTFTPLQLTGDSGVTYQFAVDSGLAPGTTSTVTESISNYADELFDSYGASSSSPAASATSTITVTGSGAAAAPEIDPAGAFSALTLLAGGLAVIRGRRYPKRT